MNLKARCCSLFTKAEALAQVVLPVALAFVLFGQLGFLAVKYYSGFGHMGKIAWFFTLASLPLVLYSQRKRLGWTVMDSCFFLMMGMVMVSYALHGFADPKTFLYYILFFGMASFLAGRVLDETATRHFIITAIALCAVLMVAACIAFVQMPSKFYFIDRPVLYPIFMGDIHIWHQVWKYDTEFLTRTGTAFVLLIIAFALRPVASLVPLRGRFWRILMLGLAFAAFWLVIRMGLRSGILALIATVICMLFAARWQSAAYRLGLLVVLLATLALSIYTQPMARSALLQQVETPTTQSDKLKGTPELNEHCQVYNNAVVTRYLYLHHALILIKQHPWLGVGPGNFGDHVCKYSKENFTSPHSYFFHMAVDNGLVAGAIYLIFVAILCLRLLMRYSNPSLVNPDLVWFVAPLWLYSLFLVQMSGNYFMEFHYHALSGLMIARLSRPADGERTV